MKKLIKKWLGIDKMQQEVTESNLAVTNFNNFVYESSTKMKGLSNDIISCENLIAKNIKELKSVIDSVSRLEFSSKELLKVVLKHEDIINPLTKTNVKSAPKKNVKKTPPKKVTKK